MLASISSVICLLAIFGERKADGKDDYHFQKRVSLPKGVDVGNIKASYKDGTLEVIMPKKAEVRKVETSVD